MSGQVWVLCSGQRLWCLVRFRYCVVDRGCDVWSGLGIV